MKTILTTHIPKLLLGLSAVSLVTACSMPSMQSISIPGSQLMGQQQKTKCHDKATGKAIPGCKPAVKAASPKKMVIKAGPPPPIKTPVSPLGVVATNANVAGETKAAPATVNTPPKPRPPFVSKVTAPTPKPVVKTPTTRRLTLSGSTNFKTNSASLNDVGKQKLASLARNLTAPNTTITRLLIEGYTDSMGAADYNQVLSLKRANAVADYLTTQGLMRSSMETVGRGENSPIADNKTRAGRAQNRRVEITATGSKQTQR